MKLYKDKIVNLLILLALAILLFTPLGFQLKVLVHKVFSFSPTELKKEDQLTIANYTWQLRDSNGKHVNFHDYKNSVVVINLWATWCPPCVAEMPEFQKLYTDYKNKVSFLFVAQDTNVKVDEFLKKKGYDLPIYYETSTAPEEFYSKSIPKTFVLDRNGQIVIAETGVAKWNSDAFRKILDTLIVEQP